MAEQVYRKEEQFPTVASGSATSGDDFGTVFGHSIISSSGSSSSGSNSNSGSGGGIGEQFCSSAAVSSSIKIGDKLAPYNPTNIDAINIALTMMKVTDIDVLYDLGCGDGRVMIEACKRYSSIRCVGVEYDSDLCEKAVKKVAEHGYQDRISVVHANVLDIDFIKESTCIFVYLVGAGLKLLAPKFKEARDKGIRIVSYVFSLPEEIPTAVEVYKLSTKLYLYD